MKDSPVRMIIHINSIYDLGITCTIPLVNNCIGLVQ